MTPQELREYAVALLVTTGNGPEERRAAAELLAALADWDPELLRRAAIGETGDGNAGETCCSKRSTSPRMNAGNSSWRVLLDQPGVAIPARTG